MNKSSLLALFYPSFTFGISVDFDHWNNLVLCSLLLSSQVLLLHSLCFLDPLTLLSVALFLLFLQVWVSWAVWAWIFTWAWAFDIFLITFFLIDSALPSDQSWLLVFFFFQSLWWNDDHWLFFDPFNWSLDSVDFIELVLTKGNVGLNVDWIDLFNNNGVAKLNLNNINRRRIVNIWCITKLLRPHLRRINSRLLSLSHILIDPIISDLCLFLLRLILNGKSIAIVGPEREQSNNKHDKNVKVIKSRSEHGTRI